METKDVTDGMCAQVQPQVLPPPRTEHHAVGAPGQCLRRRRPDAQLAGDGVAVLGGAVAI